VSDCPSCGAELKSKICPCGYAVRVSQPPPTGQFRTEQSAILRQKMGEIQPVVDAFVADYQRAHKGATKREACLEFLKAKGIQHMVPKHFLEEKFDNAMEDYRAEAEA
jgi:hypothetical protein